MKKPCQYRYDKKVLLIMAGDGKVGFGVYFLKENHEDTENTEKHGEEGIRILDLRFEGDGTRAAYLHGRAGIFACWAGCWPLVYWYG